MKISPKLKYILAAIGLLLPILGLINKVLFNIVLLADGLAYALLMNIQANIFRAVYMPSFDTPLIHLLTLFVLSTLIYFILGYLIEKTSRFHIAIPIILVIIFIAVNFISGIFFGLSHVSV